MAVQITEFFFSIQGESLDAGLPCVFVRLTGCNLRCTYCDTCYAYDGGTKMPVAAVIERIRGFGCMRVAITGGEPLAQEETPVLIGRLLDAGYRVLLETNGTLDIGRVDSRCVRIVDVKCPSSGEHGRHYAENYARLTTMDQLKFVIGDRNDYEYAKTVIRQHLPEDFPGENLLFSPVSGRLSPDRMAGWLLADGLNARLHLQLHRIIWPDRDRGV